MNPARGEVWLFDLGMAEKVRPALVISVAFGGTDRALVTNVPHTNQPSRFSVRDSRKRPILEAWRVPGARHFNLPARESDSKARRAQAGSLRFGVRWCPAMARSRSRPQAIRSCPQGRRLQQSSGNCERKASGSVMRRNNHNGLLFVQMLPTQCVMLAR